ncbi:VOC family protein [Nocardioides sp. cx-169]|uniref:VOC family protein n=1 Tax=Nocardioides sp. cx-169 TaxID=2899080 RepID=UPI001E6314BB|nr:VOC family protein [Nocardioides sp. cx-169]MCD4532545.1 VOC family protein [Nocardioides sp. cx-169]
MRLHHVQVACPRGGEDVARAFYAGALGLHEVDKPEDLRARGGAWFRAYDEAGAVTAEIHVGVEDAFIPARKAHPALVLGSAAELDAVRRRLEDAGYEVDLSQRDTFPGHDRVHTFDGHGNRVELLVAAPARFTG